jgi:hypothetical protein
MVILEQALGKGDTQLSRSETLAHVIGIVRSEKERALKLL